MIRAGAVVALLSAEALAFYALAELFAAGRDDGAGTAAAALFVLTALVSYGLLRFADEFELSRRTTAALVAVVAFAVIYGSLRLAFAGDLAVWDLTWVGNFISDAETTLREGSETLVPAVLLVVVWARSAARANDDIELELVPRAVGIPFLAVTAMVIFGAATGRSGEIARAGVAFYALAVAAMALSQLARSGAAFDDLRAGGVTASLLAGTLVATTASVLVFGLAFGLLRPVIGPPLAAATEAVLTVVLYPPAWLIENLMRWLLRDSQFPQLSQSITDQAAQASGEGGDGGQSSLQRVGTFLFRGLALALFAGLLTLAVLWFSRLRRRLKSRPDDPIATAVAGSLREDLAGLWRGLFRREPPPREGRGATPMERLYLEVSARASSSGEPRQPFETPEEYAPRLRQALQRPLTDEITAAFEQARYAGREPDSRTLADLGRRWREGS